MFWEFYRYLTVSNWTMEPTAFMRWDQWQVVDLEILFMLPLLSKTGSLGFALERGKRSVLRKIQRCQLSLQHKLVSVVTLLKLYFTFQIFFRSNWRIFCKNVDKCQILLTQSLSCVRCKWQLNFLTQYQNIDICLKMSYLFSLKVVT